MATIKLYHDTRAAAQGVSAPIKISLCLHGKTVLHTTGIKILPEQWDKVTCKIIKHPQKQYLNTVLASRLNEWNIALIGLTESGEARTASSVSELKTMILMKIYPDEYKPHAGVFLSRFRQFGESRDTEGARSVYRQTIRIFNVSKTFNVSAEIFIKPTQKQQNTKIQQNIYFISRYRINPYCTIKNNPYLCDRHLGVILENKQLFLP